MSRLAAFLAVLALLGATKPVAMSRGDVVAMRAATRAARTAQRVVERRACDLGWRWAEIQVTVVTSDGAAGQGRSLDFYCFPDQ